MSLINLFNLINLFLVARLEKYSSKESTRALMHCQTLLLSHNLHIRINNPDRSSLSFLSIARDC